MPPLLWRYCHLAMVELLGFDQTRRTGPSAPTAERPPEALTAGTVRAYSHRVMEESFVAVHVSVTLRSPTLAARSDGTAGTPCPVTVCFATSLLPPALRARSS